MSNLQIVKFDGAEAVLDGATVDAFRGGLRGPSLLAGDAGYDEARAIWNGSVDKLPAIIAECSGVADVIDAVNFAREHGIRVARNRPTQSASPAPHDPWGPSRHASRVRQSVG